MATQQTRYTYPSVESKIVRLKYRHGQKYHIGSFGYGGVELPTSQTKVYFWRYIGKRKGRFSINGFNESNRNWSDVVFNEDNMENIMLFQGFELAGVALGAGGPQYEIRSGSTANIDYGERAFKIGFDLDFKPGMRVRATFVGNASTYIEGSVSSYDRGEIVIYPDTLSGFGTYNDWNISVKPSIFVEDSNYGTSMYTDINTWNPIFSKPGLYVDMWIINDFRGDFGPTINYFRLESNLQAALWDIPRHHFSLDIWPENIPFASEDYASPMFDMMVGVTPYTKNMVNPASYQIFQNMVSTMYVDLIEIWFYRHETSGPLDSPVKISFSSPIQFTEQVFNFFWGKIPPGIFAQPGEYRLKFRVITDQGAPTIENFQYHDFWKTVMVDRSVSDISDAPAQCFKNAINVYGSLSQCSYLLKYDDAGQHLTHLAKGSATDFLEPRDKEILYDSSQTQVLNLGSFYVLGASTDTTIANGVSDHFFPLVISDGVQMLPSEPLRGFGVDGAIVRDFTMEGDTLKLQSPSANFMQILFGYNGVPSVFGKVEVIFRDETSFVLSSANYTSTIPNFFTYTEKFKMLFIRDRFNQNIRTVVPPDKYFVNNFGKTLSINRTWLESFIPNVSGYNFRVQLYTTIDAPGEDPIVVRSHMTYLNQNSITLPGKPKNYRFPEMIFKSGKPQFRHFDYSINFALSSGTPVVIGTGEKIFSTQSGRPYFQGGRIAVYAIDGSYMKGRVLSYVGTNLRVDVEEVFGSGQSYSNWFIYRIDIDSPTFNFNFFTTANENISAFYDAEI